MSKVTFSDSTRWLWIIGAGWIALLAFMNFHWGATVLNGHLNDADDYLRMVRVFDLADGRHVAANIQARMGLSGNIENNWSRLVDLPLWGFLAAFQPIFGRDTAALLTATVMPAIALLALLFSAVWYPRAAVAPSWPPTPGYVLMIFFLIFPQVTMLEQFLPGRVDHDMWQILLIMTGFGFTLRMCLMPGNLRYPAAAGALFATGLSIGADMVPWFVLGTAFAGLHFLAKGRDYERPCLVLGLSAAGTATALFFLLRPPTAFFEVVCDGISITYLSFAFAVAAFWLAIYASPSGWKTTLIRRIIISGIFAIGCLAALYNFFPICFHDPYQLSDSLVRRLWLNNVDEARSYFTLLELKPAFAVALMMSAIVSLCISVLAAAADKSRRIMWIGWCLVLTGGIFLTFWQVRIFRLLQIFYILPLAWPLPFIMSHQVRPQNTLSCRVVAAICVTAIAVSGLLFYASFKRQGEPVKAVMQERMLQRECSIKDAAPVLNNLPPSLIAALIDHGSEILYRTRQSVLAGPYHHDAAGIRAVIELFTAPDSQAAHQIIKRYGVQIVMICPGERANWQEMTNEKSYFATQLLAGQIPFWLTPIKGSGAGNFLILQVNDAIR